VPGSASGSRDRGVGDSDLQHPAGGSALHSMSQLSGMLCCRSDCMCGARAAALACNHRLCPRYAHVAHSLPALVNPLAPIGPLLRTSLHLVCSSTRAVQGQYRAAGASAPQSAQYLMCPLNTPFRVFEWPQVLGPALEKHREPPRVSVCWRAPSSRMNLCWSDLLGGVLAAL
jgi:hypothetical protein